MDDESFADTSSDAFGIGAGGRDGCSVGCTVRDEIVRQPIRWSGEDTLRSFRT